MANKKISELPSASDFGGSEIFEIVQGGTNKKATAEQVSDYIIGNLSVDTQRYNFDLNGTVAADYSTNFGSNTDVNSAWTFSAAEETTHATGANNSASFGWDHLIGNGSSSGSGANSFTAGVDLINYGNGSHVSGHRGRVTYTASTTGGFAHGLGVGYPSTVPYVTAVGGAINISRNTGAQTDGFGALAQDSFIIGGINGNIPSTSPRSGKIGGGIYNFPASTPDYVAMPNIIIFGTPESDNALASVFAYDTVSKKMKLRSVSSISPTGSNGITVSSGSVGLGGVLTSSVEIIGPGGITFGTATDPISSYEVDLQGNGIYRIKNVGFAGTYEVEADEIYYSIYNLPMTLLGRSSLGVGNPGGDLQRRKTQIVEGPGWASSLFRQRTVETTDATPTVLGAVADPSSSSDVQNFHGYITGQRTGGSAGAANDAALYRIEGVIKLGNIANIVVTTLFEDQAGWGIAAAGIGASDQILATGANNNTIIWTMNINIECLTA